MRLFTPLGGLLLCLSLGCGPGRIEMLTDRTDRYNKTVRWGNLAAAGHFISDENRKTLLEKMGREIDRRRVFDFSIADIAIDPEKRKGSVLVEFSYYGISDQSLSYRQEMQLWQWDSAKKDWFLIETRDLPARRN
ncbi:MAG: hypothetical protein V1495_05200 [Pseudomonadota bacterium]